MASSSLSEDEAVIVHVVLFAIGMVLFAVHVVLLIVHMAPSNGCLRHVYRRADRICV
jgi:hypothetical protein